MFDIPILVAKHPDSNTNFYRDTLSKFSNRKTCTSAAEALQMLAQIPAGLLIIESNLTDMTGLEMAEMARDAEAELDHFSYIVLLDTTEDDATPWPLNETSSHWIDAFVPANRKLVLGQAVMVGARLSEHINGMRADNKRLSKSNLELQKGQLLDPVTGLGNRKFAEQSLNDVIRQIESRGGAVCLLMISIENYEALERQYDTSISNELAIAVSDKILNLVRPMDVVTYFGDGLFAMVLLQANIENCTAICFERIFQGIKQKEFPSRAGYLKANIIMSLSASDATHGTPDANRLIKSGIDALTEANEAAIVVKHLSPSA